MDMLRLVLTAVMIGGGAFYFGSCLFAFSGLYRRRGIKADSATESPTVSVIIAARNEEANIGLLLGDRHVRHTVDEIMNRLALELAARLGQIDPNHP